MDDTSDDISVTDDPARSRYEITVDGQQAGFLDYATGDGTVAFTHAEVFPRFEGRGLAGRMTKVALDQAVADGRKVAPLCPYVAGYVTKHPEYLEHVEERYRADLTR